MSINIGPASDDDLRPKIMVVGVGGAGGNAIANMMEAKIEGVDFIVANTDAQALSTSPSEKRIQLGPDITGGLGAGARPEVGKAAAEETVQDIEDALDGVNMVFIAAGMGGGTGTGAAPVIAEAARKRGVLTVGVVTKPFLFEGTRRMRAAEAGIDELQKHVDTLIVIPNQNLFLVAKAETTFKEAFQLADEVLQQGVRSITDLMVMPGLINLDFADVRSVMSEMGKAMMGTGEGEGDNRALEAAEHAIANPLLDGVSMAGAKGVIISIIGGEDMKLLEVDEAANHIRELVDEDANIIWGSAFNPDLEGKIRVSVVATGIEPDGSVAAAPMSSFAPRESSAPRRPVLDLPSESEAEDEPFELNEGLSADPEPEAPRGFDRASQSQSPAPSQASPHADADDADALDLTDEAEEDDAPRPFGLSPATSGSSAERDEDGYDDVDDIVDPLAGLRNEQTERFDSDDDTGAPAAGGHGSDAEQGQAGESAGRAPLDLSGDMREPSASQDEFELGDDQGASPLASKPVRRQPIVPGDSPAPAAPSAPASGASAGSGSLPGNTLFERMANLSRGASTSEEEDEDDDADSGNGGGLNIPRFLGRQNNQ
ncbi:cell division protein FtsZ [Erythrobacter citreus]|uniref:Cell division protein FtsZ n=2 Tax=Erythrobacteraceae TaxID=335929 RepID=A0A6I4U9K5_9SPHN|nr:cell division protein FtsZ [Qipengyuania citrea]MDQ0565785.1 cell division protein FtsZ [Qipengyuania citrea]MXP34154.1 cell division protein FtsZ [Qipengyuania citrea]